ncbi:MAG: NnrU family protein, partial [Pseudomonadota bacterium]
MIPLAVDAAAWVQIAGTHLLLSSTRLRQTLATKLGERGFVIAYATIAATTASLVALAVAVVGDRGAAMPGIAGNALVRIAAGIVAFAGAAILSGGLLGYSASPMATLARRRRFGAAGPAGNESSAKPPRPLLRHPFFAGLALFAGAHVVMAATLASAAYFAGFAVLALAGIVLQDRKLERRHGSEYRDFYANRAPGVSSSGGGVPWRALFGAGAGAALLAVLHPLWAAHNGAWFMLLIVAGGSIAVARQLARPGRPVGAASSRDAAVGIADAAARRAA